MKIISFMKTPIKIQQFNSKDKHTDKLKLYDIIMQKIFQTK